MVLQLIITISIIGLMILIFHRLFECASEPSDERKTKTVDFEYINKINISKLIATKMIRKNNLKDR